MLWLVEEVALNKTSKNKNQPSMSPIIYSTSCLSLKIRPMLQIFGLGYGNFG